MGRQAQPAAVLPEAAVRPPQRLRYAAHDRGCAQAHERNSDTHTERLSGSTVNNSANPNPNNDNTNGSFGDSACCFRAFRCCSAAASNSIACFANCDCTARFTYDVTSSSSQRTHTDTCTLNHSINTSINTGHSQTGIARQRKGQSENRRIARPQSPTNNSTSHSHTLLTLTVKRERVRSCVRYSLFVGSRMACSGQRHKYKRSLQPRGTTQCLCPSAFSLHSERADAQLLSLHCTNETEMLTLHCALRSALVLGCRPAVALAFSIQRTLI